MTNVDYRPFTAENALAVSALAHAAWHATYRDIFVSQFIDDYIATYYASTRLAAVVPYLQAGEMFFDLAWHGTMLVGFCQVGLDLDAAILYRIYLLPTYIGCGIGTRLLERSETFARAHGRRRLTCFVHSKNALGIRFYLRSGFYRQPEHERDDEWYMEKDLDMMEA